MPTSMVKNSYATVLLSLVTLTLTTIPSLIGAQPSLQQRCATLDVQTLILIEDHGAAEDVLPERLAKAGLMKMEAQLACTDGRHAEGVALYDEILHTLGPINAGKIFTGLSQTK
jgi:hypothetical protein